ADEAAFVTTAGRIGVVDLVSGQERFDVGIDHKLLENLSFLRAFRDNDRYYFNLQRSVMPAKPSAVSESIVSDASLPCVHVTGELCAADVKTRRMLWQRSLGHRS